MISFVLAAGKVGSFELQGANMAGCKVVAPPEGKGSLEPFLAWLNADQRAQITIVQPK
jgi:hypothetical protein